MSARTTEVKAAEARLAHHRDDAVHAKAQLAESLDALKTAQSRLLVKRLDKAIEEQRNVEQEALAYSKNVNRLYQRAAKWKAEQKRFRSTLDGLDRFAEWAAATENDLHAIAGNLEYVWSVLEKEQEATANGGYARAQEST
ncbi:hypothetical protein JG687_00000719 [Phytophthora cactorum]|uniref:Biogenesis of lysosome-related organelles complex 1 subunit 1 n=2 Tax=Phytophthora TaxID=4783 RepID=A0A8J5MJ24_9STRA|nr:hypothetical protein PC128_g3334 [Phytophthora cactorum]KAG4058183.1 hypothetical protein PC123_g6850 [Phytophthora cactorum]KAG6973749.1 hypothetical protein JG687_00000719 [Phytophthora cactorum]KAG6976907.1 hypothetical protein JG688_00000878 [Phytophthora aleatoria]